MFFLLKQQRGPVLQRRRANRPATVFHLGTPKTGTTHIQSLSRRNQDRLLRAGVYYPDIRPEIGDFAHHSLAAELAVECPGAAVAEYADLRNRTEHVVISSEGFSELSPRGLRNLSRLHGRRKAFGVVYFRELGGFIRSFTQELVKHGWEDAFDTQVYASRLRAFVSNPAKCHLANYPAIASEIIKAFGTDVAFVAYNNVIDSEEDLFVHFWRDVLGVQASELDISGAYQNKHVGFVNLEINRLLNSRVAAMGVLPGPWVHEWLLSTLAEIKDEMAELKNLEAYRDFTTFNSDSRHSRLIEQELCAFSSYFINAAGGDRIFQRNFQTMFEWADLDQYRADHPTAIAKIDAYAKRCIAEARRF